MNKYQKALDRIVSTIIEKEADGYREPRTAGDFCWESKNILQELVDKEESFEWIPVSEKLPDEHDSIFAKSYGTDKWDNMFWRTTSNIVIAAIKYNDGTVIVKEAFTHDGEWTVEKKKINCKVIAWMPFPKPYKEKENE